MVVVGWVRASKGMCVRWINMILFLGIFNVSTGLWFLRSVVVRVCVCVNDRGLYDFQFPIFWLNM